MKHYLILLLALAIILSTELSGQGGYQKNVKRPVSNAIFDLVLERDTFYIGNFNFTWNSGFSVEMLRYDTLGNLIDINNDLAHISNVGYGGSNSRLMIRNNMSNTYSCVVSNSGVMVATFDLKTNSLIESKKYVYKNEENANYIPFGMKELKDGGHVVYGSIQFDEQIFKGESSAFILNIDNNGHVNYWKIINEINYGMLIGGSLLQYDTLRLCMSTLSKDDSKAYVYYINTNNGNLMKKVLINDAINPTNSSFPYQIYKIANNRYLGFTHKSGPTLVVYDSLFRHNKISEFGITPKYGFGYYPYFENPYQSFQDTLGNVFVATRGFVFSSYPYIDENAIEAFSISKFNNEGDLIWETIDTIDVIDLGINNRYRDTYISSVNVSPTGSIYVSGHYTDSTEIFRVDTITTTYYWAYDSISMHWFQAIKDTLYYDTTTQINRNIGFLFKYDKNGCRIDNCRMVDNTDSDSDRENNITNFKIYPNPTLDVLNIEHIYNREDLDFSIIDYLGKIVMKGHLSQGLSEVDVSLLNSGLYVMLLKLDGKVLASKVFEKL
ncbi:MAG: T9SS type A sorting domain-containing protein [Saprospiraceae bacterium]